MSDTFSQNARLSELTKELAGLYSDVEDSRRVTAAADVRADGIAFHPRALTNWFHILEEAEKQNRIKNIVEVAEREYPGRLGELAKGPWDTPGTTDAPPTTAPGGTNGAVGSPDRESTILHEFGHALGLVHEYATPASQRLINWQVVYAKAAQDRQWTKELVDRNLRPPKRPVSRRSSIYKDALPIQEIGRAPLCTSRDR